MPAELEQLGAAWAEAVAADLAGLTGTSIELSGPEIGEEERDRLLPRSGPFVQTVASTQAEPAETLRWVAGQRGAQVLAALKMGRPADDLDALGAFEGEVLTAAHEMLELCAGILGRVLEEEAGLPALGRAETACLEVPAGDEPPSGRYRRARFALKAEGFPDEHLDLWIPAALAASWFGAREGGTDEGPSDDRPLMLIDPSPESRDQMADLAGELGRKVFCVDPADLGPHTFEEVAESAAVILCWDLGGRSGLDWLERLCAEAPEVRFAMASEEPTRPKVAAALRWGATTFLAKPFELDEIRSRLLAG